MSSKTQEVLEQAQEIVRKATQGFVFEEVTDETRQRLGEAVVAEWRKLAELIPPHEPFITITTEEDGSATEVWACIPVPYYVKARMEAALDEDKAAWPCPGIPVEPLVYSGCSGGEDCPVCLGERVRAETASTLVEMLKPGRTAD